MKFRLEVTINWKDGTEKALACNPQSLYNLKKVIGEFIEDSRGSASSFVFTVVKTDV